MSRGCPKFLVVPRTADGRGVAPTRFGVLVRVTPEGEFIVREGYGNQLNWEWLEARELLSFQLLCGPTLRSTRVTLDGISAGALDQLLRVVRRVQPPAFGTRTRLHAQEAATLDPSGLLVVEGSGLLATPFGLGRFDGFHVAGGQPRSEYDHAAQSGRVPLGAHCHRGRFSDVADKGAERFLSMPIRFDAGGAGGSRVPAGGGLQGSRVDVSSSGPPWTVTVNGEQVASVSTFAGAQAAAGQIHALMAQQRVALDAVTAFLGNEWDESTPEKLAESRARRDELVARVNEINAQLAAAGLDVSGDAGGFVTDPDNLEPGAKGTDATARPNTPGAIELWGSMDAMDIQRITALAEELRGSDPDLYQLLARWAPHVWLDPEILIGTPEEKKKKRKKKEEDDPQPPPGGGGGGGGKKEEKPEPDPQEQRNRDSFGPPGEGGVPTGGAAIPVPPTANAALIPSIDDGNGEPIPSEHEGIERVNGEDQDNQDAGTDVTQGSRVTSTPTEDGKSIVIRKDGRIVRIQRLSGGILTGTPLTYDPAQPTECPIAGGKTERVETEYISKNGQKRIKVTENGRTVEDRLAPGQGGVLPEGGLPTGGLQ